VPTEWRATDIEGLSRWRTEMELAIQDAVELVAAGEEDVVVVERTVTASSLAGAATRAAHARAARLEEERQRPLPVPTLIGDRGAQHPPDLPA
jgi:hypothetical protein